MAIIIDDKEVTTHVRPSGVFIDPTNMSRVPPNASYLRPGERRIFIENHTNETLFVFDMAGTLLYTINGTGPNPSTPFYLPLSIVSEVCRFKKTNKDKHSQFVEQETEIVSTQIGLSPEKLGMFRGNSQPIHIPIMGLIIADEFSKHRVMTIEQTKKLLQASFTNNELSKYWRIEYDPSHPVYDKYRAWKRVPFFIEMNGEVITVGGTPVEGLGNQVKIFTRVKHHISPEEDNGELEHVFTMDNVDVRDRGMVFNVKSDLGINKYHISNDYAMILQCQKESISVLNSLHDNVNWKEKFETLKEETDKKIFDLKEEISNNQKEFKRKEETLKEEMEQQERDFKRTINNMKETHRFEKAKWECEREEERLKHDHQKHGVWHKALDIALKVANVAVAVATVVGKLFFRRA